MLGNSDVTLAAVFSVVLLCACETESPVAVQNRFSADRDTRSARGASVEVSNVDELYAAVNDASNAGRVVLLDSGQYVLNPNRLHGGRVELQRGMELRGKAGRREDVTIDASQLPIGSFRIPPYGTGAVRMREGSVVEWLTVRSATLGVAAIETDLVSGAVARVTIAHVLVTGSQRGLDVRNLGAARAGQVLEADLLDNRVEDNTLAEGIGIRIVNAFAPGARIRATLRDNLSRRNLHGCFILNLNTSLSVIDVESTADQFDSNGSGCQVDAGVSTTGTTPVANGNGITFRAYGSSFNDNTIPLPISFPQGGLVIDGAFSLRPNAASNNHVEVSLWGSGIGGNIVTDINAWGARSPSSAPAGTNNSALIALHGVSAKATVLVTPSTPYEPAGTNSVTLVR